MSSEQSIDSVEKKFSQVGRSGSYSHLSSDDVEPEMKRAVSESLGVKESPVSTPVAPMPVKLSREERFRKMLDQDKCDLGM